MIQKKKTEGEKPVAVCTVHELESQVRAFGCSGEADEGVAIRGALKEFCRCGGGFDPGFGEADNIRMVRLTGRQSENL